MFERVKGWFQKESRTSQVIFRGSQQAQWSKREYSSFADEGYSKNVIAYQAIQKTAQAVAAIPWIARRPSGDELTDHPLLRLIRNPNPSQSGQELIEAAIGFYRIAGNSYLERTMAGRMPKELYALRPDRMTIKPGQGMPSKFVYRLGQDEVSWDVDPRTGESDILHLRTFNPLDDWYGLSPIEAGAYSVDTHNEANAHVMALMQNGASPSGALEVGADGKLGDDEYNRLKAEIDEKYTGARNAGRPLLLEGGMKWVQMGLSPQAMGIIETRYAAARDVSLALSVPPLLLNIPGDSTYSNYKEARLAFYEETVIPLAERLRDELNGWLSPYFGGVTLDLDLEKVPAIAEKRAELWEMANQATDLTINERREMRGYEPVAGGDMVYIPSGLIPLSFDSPEDDRSPADAGREAYGDTDRE